MAICLAETCSYLTYKEYTLCLTILSWSCVILWYLLGFNHLK